MNDFINFKAAAKLLADASANAENAEQLALALASRRDNAFHDFDFMQYVVNLQNAIWCGLEKTIEALDDEVGSNDH